MIKNLKIYVNNFFKQRIASILMAGITGLCFTSCTQTQKQIDPKSREAYTLEQYEDYTFQYKVVKYDAEKCKNKKYELKGLSSYDVKCTPIEFKKYTNDTNITWAKLKETISTTNFDEYHKQVLLNGIKNLQKNNFNMDLSVLNYNLKNINIKHKSKYDKEDILGTFNCFNHEITVSDNIDDKEKYEEVFLHEMLGHGMTDAYIEDKKVYCSIDQPTYVIDENNNYIGKSLYGEAFNEATAQIIAITALDKNLQPKYRCAYDMTMVELLMLCEDNNCKIEDYANNGVNLLTKKIKQNKIDDPNGIIAVITYNMNEKVNTPSEQVMYNYFVEVVDDSYAAGKTFKEINNRVSKAFNAYHEYVLSYDYEKQCDIVGLDNDIINLTRLYNDIGKYASQKTHTLS